MVSLCPRRMKLRAARQVFLVAGDDLFHGARHAAQVGAFHVGVDVDHRLHVVMADVALLGAGDDRSQIAQHLHRLARRPGAAVEAAEPAAPMALRARRRGGGAARARTCAVVARPVMGRLFRCGHRVQLVLRRLDGDVVRNAVARIEIEVGAGLEAAAQRHQQALRHVLLRQPGRLRRACGPR